MSEFFPSSLAAGLLLGGFFFGGLWWTVVRGVASQWAALWFLGSMLLRMTLTLAVFYFVGRDHWERWLLCLLGFLLARLAVQWLARPPLGHGNPRAPAVGYAP
jgi:F1F0 ATPase subunit 2